MDGFLKPSLSARKCSGLGLINRVPEAELDQKLFIIRRDHARFKLDSKLQETKLWHELYQNHRELKTSFITKYSYDEAMENKHLFCLPVDSGQKANPTQLSSGEEYKQFIIFRAHTMLKMYGPNGSKYFDRPKYSEVNKGKVYFKKKNIESIEKIKIKHHDDQVKDNKLLKVLSSHSAHSNSKRRVNTATSHWIRKTNRLDRETPISRLSQSYTNLSYIKENENQGQQDEQNRMLRAKTEEYRDTRRMPCELTKMPTIAVNAI